MPPLKSQFLRNAHDRGFIHQCTNLEQLDNLLASQKVTAYIGFDCTAPSLHAGSLVSIMLLRLLQNCGHKPIILMGGGTTKIGDPSGKEESRTLVDDKTIQTNMTGIKENFSRFLKFGSNASDAIMVNNDDWLNSIEYVPFLRNYGRHFSVNRMLSFDSVKLRLNREQPLSFLEFNYMILQAYDFLELARRKNCVLQMGGSDQWGNIVNGIELARKIDKKELFGLTTPLLTSSSGSKMGKTADGAVWLNENFLSPFDYWQFWRNSEDSDVVRFLRLFTELSLQEIKDLEAMLPKKINEVKKVLATQATKLCHGIDAANQAKNTAEKTFEQNDIGENLPRIKIAKSRLDAGIAAFELFTETGLASSKSEARRLIKNNGGKINDVTIADETRKVTCLDANSQGLIKVAAGRKKLVLVEIKHSETDPS